ncbi:MAG: phosphoribosylaminoimidazolesuccinocarboxamide synthase [Planctomycetota bacterium]
MEILMIFGSTSDHSVYQGLQDTLSQKHEVHFEIISAHRNPERLQERLAWNDYELVIAGAGLAAHLPGVAASQIEKPVFGVAVDSQFGGIDAFLSILQMPFGVPVLTSAPSAHLEISDFLNSLESQPDFFLQNLAVVVPSKLAQKEEVQNELHRLEQQAQEWNIPLKRLDAPIPGQPAILFVSQIEEVCPHSFHLHVPILMSSEKNLPAKALEILQWAKTGGLWVGANNSRNALLAWKKLAKNKENRFPLLLRGSVKNIRGKQGKSPYLFEYSNRYSVFDWGHMPDQILGKGKSLAFMGWIFFKLLGNPEYWRHWKPVPSVPETPLLQRFRNTGCPHHSLGLVTLHNEPLSADEFSEILAVQPVAVLRPIAKTQQNTLQWNYSAYQQKPVSCLVPLEVIFRFAVPPGSSLVSRANEMSYCRDIGLTKIPQENDIFAIPVVEFSTKLESEDRYITYSEAKSISGMNENEFQQLREYVLLLALRLKDFFREVEMDLLDGKFEFAFVSGASSQQRDFMLVDSIGPDELRLTYRGQQLSKEKLRTFYRKTSWYDGVVKSKKMAQERGEKNWKRICREELNLLPPPLDPKLKESVEMMYQALANTLSLHFTKKNIFPQAWSLEEVIQRQIL